MPLSARARADVWTRAPADVLPSVVDVGLVMRLGRGIGMDVLDLPAVGAGMDGTPFQALDRPPSVTTQHAPKIHDHLLPRYSREVRRRAFPLLAPGINFRFSTVIPTAHHGNRRHRPHLPLSVRGCAVERSSGLVVLIDALDAVRPEGDAIE